jgi:hypothetical protein
VAEVTLIRELEQLFSRYFRMWDPVSFAVQKGVLEICARPRISTPSQEHGVGRRGTACMSMNRAAKLPQ